MSLRELPKIGFEKHSKQPNSGLINRPIQVQVPKRPMYQYFQDKTSLDLEFTLVVPLIRE